MEYQIISVNNKAFWNNQEGWVGIESGTIFTEEERNTLNLPCDGRWVPYFAAIPRTVGELREYLALLPQNMAIGLRKDNIGRCDDYFDCSIAGSDDEKMWSSDAEVYRLCIDVRRTDN
jgi:hypothetical protein